MNLLTRNKQICNYHFLNDMNSVNENIAKESEAVSAEPSSVVASSQELSMASSLKVETPEPNELKSQLVQHPVERLASQISTVTSSTKVETPRPYEQKPQDSTMGLSPYVETAPPNVPKLQLGQQSVERLTSQKFEMASSPGVDTPNEPKAQLVRQPVEKHTETVDISDQRRQFMKLLNRKEKRIENLSAELQHLETRLQAAVTDKMDALSRLDKIEGRGQALSFKEKQMNLDAERLNNTIASLTEDLNKNVAELKASRKEIISVSAQFEIDKKAILEQLRMANLSIDDLSSTNEMLKTKNEDFGYKLRQQCFASGKMRNAYEAELKAKTILVELYKENMKEYEAEVAELTDGINELKRMLNETIDESGIVYARLEECQLDHQTELSAKDELIAKLRQELEDANNLLRTSDRYKNNTENAADVENDLPLVSDHPTTFTELYSQWRSVGKQLKNKEEECKMLETELKRLNEEVRDKAVNFDKQQKELETSKADNHQRIEEKNYLLVEKVVNQEKLESCRLRCELLERESDKLKLCGNEYLSRLFSNDQPKQKLDLPVTSVDGNASNIGELEQQNDKLLGIINSLLEKFHRESRQSTGYAAATNESISDAANCSRKSDESPENGLRTFNTTWLNHCDNGNANQKSQTVNSLKIEVLKHEQDNFKLQNANAQLIAEKNLLLSEQSLFDVRYDFLKNKIADHEKEKEEYMNIIKRNDLANKYLKDDNTNVSAKLSTVQDRLTFLESQHRTLFHIKNALEVEVETSKQELAREKVANKTLGHKVESMKKSLGRMKIELQMRMSESSDSRIMLQKLSAGKANDPSQGDISKILMDESVQTDFGSETSRRVHAGICNEKERAEKTSALDSLQSLPDPANSFTDRSSQSIASAQTNSRKRKSGRTAAVSNSSNRSSGEGLLKKKCEGSIDLLEESDEEAIIDVGGVDSSCCDLPNIKLQYLSEVKTRKQARFILDAFNCVKPELDLHKKPDQKRSNPKNTRDSRRSRSSNNRLSSENVKASRRSQSARSIDHTSNVEHRQSHNMDTDVKHRNRERGHAAKRSRSYSSGRSDEVSRVRSRYSHQPQSARNQKSNVDRQQPTDNDCYIIESTTSGAYPTRSRRSRRLISRFIRITANRKQNAHPERIDGDCKILQPAENDHNQSTVGHEKSNVDRQQWRSGILQLAQSDNQSVAGKQSTDDGDCNVLQSTMNGIGEDSEFSSTNTRRSRRLEGQQKLVTL